MPYHPILDQVAERVERLLLRHEELQRTNALLSEQVEALTQERNSLKSRLSAARARVDALLDNIEDYGTRLSVSIRVTDEAVRDALRAELAARWLPEWFALLTRRLNEAGAGWLVGPALSVADLKAVHLIDKLINGSLAGLRTDALDDFPALAAWRERVHAERLRRLPA
jgi:glutathione S-transferase